MDDPELNEVMDEILAISKEVREMEEREALAKTRQELLERIADLAANDPAFMIDQIKDVRQYASEHPEDEALNALIKRQDEQLRALWEFEESNATE